MMGIDEASDGRRCARVLSWEVTLNTSHRMTDNIRRKVIKESARHVRRDMCGAAWGIKTPAHTYVHTHIHTYMGYQFRPSKPCGYRHPSGRKSGGTGARNSGFKWSVPSVSVISAPCGRPVSRWTRSATGSIFVVSVSRVVHRGVVGE